MERSVLAFFDLETTKPTRGQGCAILEFGSILVCPKTLMELDSYATLVRPADLSLVSTPFDRGNGITSGSVVSAPTFAEIADRVYDLLHGKIWAGHNILEFDCPLIEEAFAEINRPAPEPKETIDSLVLLRERFGRRAGDLKMATLATYFGLGQQKHRNLEDVRMNLEVLKKCATVLFLQLSDHMEVEEEEENELDFPNSTDFVHINEVSMARISVDLAPYRGSQRIRVLHESAVFQLCCSRLKVRFGLSTRFADHEGRPRLSFVVEASPELCRVLDACDDLVYRFSIESGCSSRSEWRPVVSRKPGFPVPLQSDFICPDGLQRSTRKNGPPPENLNSAVLMLNNSMDCSVLGFVWMPTSPWIPMIISRKLVFV